MTIGAKEVTAHDGGATAIIASHDDAEAILPFPLQNALTRPARPPAATQDRADYPSLWAGQGVRLSRRLPAAELVREIAKETVTALDLIGSPEA